MISKNKKLSPEDTFTFDCHPGVACFTRCCQDADMYLYPYDVIRLKRHLGISSNQFLEKYTFQAFRDNPYFPNVMLKMSDNIEKSCLFLSSAGCAVYKDRPFSCRAYPLERAVARTGEDERAVIHFISKPAYCLGHQETKTWTIKAWIEDQQIQIYNDMNDLWVDMDTLFRRNPWGAQGIDNPALKMAFMACFNVDEFRTFIFESTFLSRFDVPRERAETWLESDVEIMKFGFEWVTFFLTGTGPLTLRTRA
jgi:uncharacterized protein